MTLITSLWSMKKSYPFWDFSFIASTLSRWDFLFFHKIKHNLCTASSNTHSTALNYCFPNQNFLFPHISLTKCLTQASLVNKCYFYFSDSFTQIKKHSLFIIFIFRWLYNSGAQEFCLWNFPGFSTHVSQPHPHSSY